MHRYHYTDVNSIMLMIRDSLDESYIRLDWTDGFRAITLPAAERRTAAQALAGDDWRVVSANAQVFGTQPPSPKMLRECANILETAPYQRTKTAAWLREIAEALGPEPDPQQVEALAALLEQVDGQLDLYNLIHPDKYARELVRRGVRVGEQR